VDLTGTSVGIVLACVKFGFANEQDDMVCLQCEII
jgi:hypothetical protein